MLVPTALPVAARVVTTLEVAADIFSAPVTFRNLAFFSGVLPGQGLGN